MNNNISFKSNIIFIPTLKFANNHNKGIYIGYQHNVPNIIKAGNFFSESIRTCTGGGIINNSKEAIGFHLWDDKINKKKFQDLVIKMFRYIKNPQRGLLIGGKNLSTNPYSLEQFTKFKNEFEKRIPFVTIFEKHKHQKSESHFAYSTNNDTWLISTIYVTKDGSLQQIKSVNDLKEAFERIKIAKGDRLFIGKKEINKTNYPELFE